MILILNSLIALVFLATPAIGQNIGQLGKVTAINVVVNDGVKDGCLPRPHTLRNDAELILRRSGITVVESGDVSTIPKHTLRIDAVGFAIIGGCTTSLTILLSRYEKLDDGSVGEVYAARTSSIFAGPHDRMTLQLREAVNETVSNLADKILKARQK
jgi:hypothetical protein